MTCYHSYPPKNAKVAINASNGPSMSAAGTSFYPTSSLAQSEIWDFDVRQPLLKPTFKKSEIDSRRSKVTCSVQHFIILFS